MNYEVKCAYSVQDENTGKISKKSEIYLVKGAVSCADAEYILIKEKLQHLPNEVTIISAKESKLVLINEHDCDLFDWLYRVTEQVVVSEDGDKSKFSNCTFLVPDDSIEKAMLQVKNQRGEIIAASKSRIIEIIEKSEKE